jgi:hypothetical protein
MTSAQTAFPPSKASYPALKDLYERVVAYFIEQGFQIDGPSEYGVLLSKGEGFFQIEVAGVNTLHASLSGKDDVVVEPVNDDDPAVLVATLSPLELVCEHLTEAGYTTQVLLPGQEDKLNKLIRAYNEAVRVAARTRSEIGAINKERSILVKKLRMLMEQVSKHSSKRGPK